MASKFSPFPLIRQTITALKAGLPGQITAFNAEAANLVDLVAPAAAAYYEGGSDALAAVGFPAVEVHVAHFALGPYAIERVEADIGYVLTIVVWAEGDKGEIPTLYEALAGYARCVLEVLLPDGQLGTGEVTNNTSGSSAEVYFAILPGDPTDDGRTFEKWRGSALVTLRVDDVTAIP